MAKSFKNFISGGRKTEENANSLNEKLAKSSVETQEAFYNFEKNPSPETYIIYEEKLNTDRLLTIEEKENLLNSAKNDLLELSTFNNYQAMEIEDIEKDIFNLKMISNIATYLIGDRLLFIQDQFDVKQGKISERLKEYGSFEKYMQIKLGISRQRGYSYMGIAKYIKLVNVRLQVDPSKFKPYLPILKQIDNSDKSDNRKLFNDLLLEIISKASMLTYRENEEFAKIKKIELGLIKNIGKNEKEFNEIVSKEIDQFLKLLNNSDIDEYNKIKLLRVAEKINSIVKN